MDKNLIKVNSDDFTTENEYVFWIDIMGTKNSMSESFHKAANFILKFHCAVLRAVENNNRVRVYPLMDGVFITSNDISILKPIINSIFKTLYHLFITESQHAHRFIIKGSIAYGPIAHGENITTEVCEELHKNSDYRKSLMCGMPMIQAFNDEHKAPPFGVYIHESARINRKLSGRYYDWYHKISASEVKKLRNTIKLYFEWCDKHHQYLCLDPQKIQLYQHLVKEYFSDRAGRTLPSKKIQKEKNII